LNSRSTSTLPGRVKLKVKVNERVYLYVAGKLNGGVNAQVLVEEGILVEQPR
jgi:hypothetical protein